MEMEWSGIMAFGKNKIPIVRRENQYTAIGVKLEEWELQLEVNRQESSRIINRINN